MPDHQEITTREPVTAIYPGYFPDGIRDDCALRRGYLGGISRDEISARRDASGTRLRRWPVRSLASRRDLDCTRPREASETRLPRALRERAGCSADLPATRGTDEAPP